MLLAIDIGNTIISLGLLKKNRVVKVFSIEAGLPSKTLKTRLSKALRLIKKKYSPLDGIIVCSVVPRISKTLKNLIAGMFPVKALFVGQQLKVPMKNRYRKPKQVGQDRLVCAYAAMSIYGAPAIVIDFGTAITFDIISRNKEYLGGIIVPGIRLSAESLFKKTALLPRVQIKSPRSIVGKDTEESILSGLFYGYGTMSKGLVELISKKIKGKPKVIATGGYTKLMKKFSSQYIKITDKDLVFKGMGLLFSRHNKGS